MNAEQAYINTVRALNKEIHNIYTKIEATAKEGKFNYTHHVNDEKIREQIKQELIEEGYAITIDGTDIHIDWETPNDKWDNWGSIGE